jgi:hypothetical protein
MSNPWEEFVFRAKSRSRNCSNGKRCSHCASKINVAIKVKESFVSIDKCAKKQALITKISSNPVLAATETCMAQEEIRRLRRELAQMVLQEAVEKDGTVLPDGAVGDQIRQAVGIMDGPITKTLQLGAAMEGLELWQVHTEHINRVFVNGGKSRGHQNATYHPKLTNWAIAFLACTSSGTYNKVAKTFMLPHISTVY